MESVAVYRSHFGQLSETFVRDHIASLKSFRPLVICDRQETPGSVTPEDFYEIEGNSLQRLALREFGHHRGLGNALAQRKVRIVHAHFLFDGARIVRFARRNGLKLVVTAHGYDATLWPEFMRKSRDGRLLLRRTAELIKSASAIICVSDFIKQELINRGYPAELLHVVHCGIDLSKIEVGLPASERRGVLFAGRLVEKKGVKYLLEAFAQLPASIQAEGLTIVGGGPLQDELQQRAATLGIAPRFLGPRPRETILKLMGEARVFVLPSVRAASGDSEGLPIVLMEAQATGTPCVVFDERPMIEAIAAGSGLSAEYKNPRSLAEKIASICTEEGLARRIGRDSIDNARRNFSVSHNGLVLEDLYATL